MGIFAFANVMRALPGDGACSRMFRRSREYNVATTDPRERNEPVCRNRTAEKRCGSCPPEEEELVRFAGRPASSCSTPVRCRTASRRKYASDAASARNRCRGRTRAVTQMKLPSPGIVLQGSEASLRIARIGCRLILSRIALIFSQIRSAAHIARAPSRRTTEIRFHRSLPRQCPPPPRLPA